MSRLCAWCWPTYITVNPEYFERTQFSYPGLADLLYAWNFRTVADRSADSLTCFVPSHAFYFCTEAATYEIYENNMHTKYSGFTVCRIAGMIKCLWRDVCFHQRVTSFSFFDCVAMCALVIIFQIHDEDSDVAAERGRVDDIIGEPETDVVLLKNLTKVRSCLQLWCHHDIVFF